MSRKKTDIKHQFSILNIILRFWWVWVLVAVAVTYTLCMVLAIGQSIWFDEGYSIMLARQSVDDIFALTAVDAHPPLYYLVLKAWASLFGWSEFALRSLSAVATAGAVGVGLILLRTLFSTRLALAAIPLLVFAPFLLRYGYEVRMYALTTLIAILATLVLVFAVRHKRWWLWAMYAFCVALGMYTLYLIAAVWVAHVVWLVVRSIRNKVSFTQWRWPLAYAGAVLLYVPYLSTFLYQLQNSALPGIGSEVTLTSLVNIFTSLSLYRAEWQVGGWLTLLLVIIGIGVVWQFITIYKRVPASYRSSLTLLGLLSVIPIVFFMLSSLPPRDPIFVVRYMAHVALFWYMFVAAIVILGYRYGNRALSMFMLVGCLVLAFFGTVQLQSTGNFNFERMQDPQTVQLRSAITCNDKTMIVADDPYTYIDSIYYFDGCDTRFFSKDTIEKKGGYAPLHESSRRIASPDEIQAPVLVHLSWTGADAQFTPSSQYQLSQTTTYDKQVVTIYKLIAE